MPDVSFFARLRLVPADVRAAFALGALAIVFAVVLSLRHPAETVSPTRPVAPPHRIAVKPAKAPKVQSPPKQAVLVKSAFALEQMMSPAQLMKRWNADIAEAAKRFKVPAIWIRAVMQAESGGRTMLAEGLPMTSSQGAMGLMQLMPETYEDMRRAYRLGSDPFAPHDNIIAGAAYLRFLHGKYGYPQMFAAYNDGPGNLEQRLRDGGLLPQETRDYLVRVTGKVEGRSGGSGLSATFTRPDGTPVKVDIGAVTSVRAAFRDEYAPGVQSVIKVGRKSQGVRENLEQVKTIIRNHGGAI